MKYAFIVSCSLDYLFALNCTMNAAKFYGTNADFLVVYDESITESIRNSYTDAFPFKIRWFHLDNWLAANSIPVNKVMSRFWIAAWVVASEMIEHYEAICILQADEFLVNNVNAYFKIAAETDIVVASEWTCCNEEFEDLFDSKEIKVVLFDQLVFVGKQNKKILKDTWKQQIAENIPEQINHPMYSLSKACKENLNKDKVLGLDGHTWCWDRDEFDFKVNWTGSKFYNERKIRVNGIHTKVWKEGLDQSALNRARTEGRNPEIALHNFNTIKDVMIHFNEMTPAVKRTEYCNERFV